MKNFYSYIITFIPLLINAQVSLESKFYNIGNRGNSELKNLKLSENNLFFTGKEFDKYNFARYNFNSQQFITYKQEKENAQLGYENYNYATVNDNIFFISQNNDGTREILYGLENGDIEKFIQNQNITNISSLEQFDYNYFFFTTTEKIPATNNIKNNLWISNGTKEGTKIIHHSSNYYNFKIVTKVGDELYYTFEGRTYTYNTKTEEIKNIFSSIENSYFIFKNKIYFFKNNYDENSSDLFVLNNENSIEKITSLNNTSISNEIKYYVIGEKVYIYTNNSDSFYTNAYLYVFNSIEKTINKVFEEPVRKIDNTFHHNENFYFSVYTQDNKYKNYILENDSLVEIDYKVENNLISSAIVFDNKIFFNGDRKINFIDLLTMEKNEVNENTFDTPAYTYFFHPFIYNNELYFSSTDDLNGNELFKYNKSSNTKSVVFNYNKTIGSQPMGFQKVDNNILFFANDNFLHKFNPTNKQHNIILDENHNRIKGIFSEMIANFNDKKIIFSTDNFELGFSDGTEQGTFIFNKAETNENFLEFYTSRLIPINNKIVFIGNTKHQGTEPWVTDGTRYGTFMLKDIMNGYESSVIDINENGILNDKIYFSAVSDSNPINSNSIYVTDGTTDGTKSIYIGDVGFDLSVNGHYKNYLVIGKTPRSTYYGDYFLLDPITMEEITLDHDYNPFSFFEFEGKLYCSEYNSFYYYDENYKVKFIENRQSMNLIKIGIIHDKMYLYSDTNGHVYSLKNNILEKIDDELLQKKDFKMIDNFIYYIQGPFIDNQLKGNYLKIINKDGLKTYKLNFIDETNKSPYIEEYKIIDNVLYLSKNHDLYGLELYTVDLSEQILSNTEIITPINILSNFDLYPNPSSDYFKVKSKTNKKLTITIFDTNGRKIKSVNSIPNENIDIKKFSKGIYIIHIDNGINKENKKLIVK